jgi:hypothetical protein
MREDRKRIQTTKYFAAFAITTLIFIAGILIGNYLGSLKYNAVRGLQDDLFFDTLGLDVKYDLLLDLDCSEINISKGTPVDDSDMRAVGQKLAFLESQFGANDPQVRKLKEYYHILEIKHMILAESLEDKCNLSANNLIFFYAIDEICESCLGQGEILTFLHRKYPKFNVYSFDINIDNPALNTLKERYGIVANYNVPAIVYDEEVYMGFLNKENAAKVIFQKDLDVLRDLKIIE